MFNPIYNKDGSLCLFRVSCLAIAVGCFVCGCVVQDKKAKNNYEDKVNTVLEAQNAPEPVVEEKKTDVEAIRAFALHQLNEDFEYLLTCGTLDNGFDNCTVELDQSLTPYYELSLETGADGFTLDLKSLPSLNDDSCSLISANSNGEIRAYDNKGSENTSCISARTVDNSRFGIVRDTDTRHGQLAPSGLSEMVKTLSKN
ncbi:MAG: hypothetical protein IJ671_00875 [Succinivibrio sp.]|nr:hypothetical protein [Succinivibrio sp.]MBR1612088.1 hypothetical protein [Succinivibrio sp.]